MFDRSISLAGILLMTTPAIARPPESVATVPAATQTEKLICRAANSAASRLSEKTCYTQAEWDAISARNGEDLDKNVRSRQMNTQPIR